MLRPADEHVLVLELAGDTFSNHNPNPSPNPNPTLTQTLALTLTPNPNPNPTPTQAGDTFSAKRKSFLAKRDTFSAGVANEGYDLQPYPCPTPAPNPVHETVTLQPLNTEQFNLSLPTPSYRAPNPDQVRPAARAPEAELGGGRRAGRDLGARANPNPNPNPGPVH